MTGHFSRITVILVIVALTGLAGCGRTGPSRFYTLGALSANTFQKNTEKGLSVCVGPVEISDYLERPQIVTRSSQNEIQLAEFDKWAGSLKNNIARVLAGNLSALLDTDQVSVFPWRAPVPAQYQVSVQVNGLDAIPGEKVWIDAQWMILGQKGRKLVRSERTRLSLPVAKKDYAAIVAAQSRLLDSLSREIAEALTTAEKAR